MQRILAAVIVSSALCIPFSRVVADDQAAPTTGQTPAPSPAQVAPAVAPAPTPPSTPAPGPKIREGRRGQPEEPPQEITLTGKITREEFTNKKGETSYHYFLTDPQGMKIALPSPPPLRHKRGDIPAPAAISLDDYVDAAVKLVGMGHQSINAKGKTIVRLASIKTIDKVPAAVQ